METNEFQETFTDLISLGDSEDSTDEILQLSIASKKYTSEAEFQSEINKLKAESTRKFRNKWEQILYKYSLINDDVESDEIDLFTGKVTIDNGHLRSLQTYVPNKEGIKQNVWDIEYDAERDEQTAKRKEKEELKKKHRLKNTLKAESLFHLNNISRSRHNSPVRKVSPDNILLLDPSPTKKQRVSPTKKETYPIDIESPKSVISDTEDELPLLDLPKSRFTEADTDDEEEEEDNPNIFMNEASYLDEPRNQLKRATNYLGEPIETKHSSMTIIDPLHEARESCQSSDSLDFDDQYLIVDYDTQELTSEKGAIYTCCFHKCDYTTGNKKLFESHLLLKHRTELYIIGYPISKDEIDRTKRPLITQKMIDLLNRCFPLSHEVPMLPLSADRKMLNCNLKLNDSENRCRREFLTKYELSQHQNSFPLKCSGKVQVYVCPLLGCGYMTDEGYLSWRQHFIDENHWMRNSVRGKITENNNGDSDSFTRSPTKDVKNQQLLEKLHTTPVDKGSIRVTDKMFNVPNKSVLKSINKELDDLFQSDED